MTFVYKNGEATPSAEKIEMYAAVTFRDYYRYRSAKEPLFHPDISLRLTLQAHMEPPIPGIEFFTNARINDLKRKLEYSLQWYGQHLMHEASEVERSLQNTEEEAQ